MKRRRGEATQKWRQRLESCGCSRTKVHLVKAMIFPVVAYGYESWTIKNAEHQRIDAFELWHLKRLLRVPWTATSNQALKEITLNIHWMDCY